jgi:hypothetical protein
MSLGTFSSSFKYPYPLFGRGAKNRLPLSQTQRSPYYWWWEYLRRNDAYRQCCLNGGTGKLGKLYADFGDVHELEFRLWWQRQNRGAYLFTETKITDRIQRFTSLEKCAIHLQTPGIMLAAIPLNESKAKLRKSFNLFLRDFHPNKQERRGRRQVVSNARYPFCAVPVIPALAQALDVYDKWKMYLDSGNKKSLADIGMELRLVTKFMPSVHDKPSEVNAKRNKMSATVSRYIKDAQAMIDNTALGRFPDKSRPIRERTVSHTIAPRVDIYNHLQRTLKKNPKVTLADIGFELKLGKPEWLPQPSDTKEVLTAKRNKMSATVSRYVKNAKSLLDAAAHTSPSVK